MKRAKLLWQGDWVRVSLTFENVVWTVKTVVFKNNDVSLVM